MGRRFDASKFADKLIGRTIVAVVNSTDTDVPEGLEITLDDGSKLHIGLEDHREGYINLEEPTVGP